MLAQTLLVKCLGKEAHSKDSNMRLGFIMTYSDWFTVDVDLELVAESLGCTEIYSSAKRERRLGTHQARVL